MGLGTFESRATSPAEPSVEQRRTPPDSGAPKAALDAFDRGVEAYEKGAYADALAAFEEAARLHPSPDYQYNIGRSHEELGQSQQAVAAYQRYLQQKPHASDREDVEARIAHLAGRPAPVLKDAPAPPLAPQTLPRRASGPPRGHGLVIAGATLVGVGVGGALAGAIGFGVLADRKSDELRAITREGNPSRMTFAQATGLQRDGERFEQLQAATAGAGAAIAMVGTIMAVLGARRKQVANVAAQTRGARALTLSSGCTSGGLCFGVKARF